MNVKNINNGMGIFQLVKNYLENRPSHRKVIAYFVVLWSSTNKY